jgi:hypothetical protein
MVGETGIEPVTPDLEGPCSIQLSYSPDVLRLGPTLRPQVADTQGITIRCIDCSGAAGGFKLFTPE